MQLPSHYAQESCSQAGIRLRALLIAGDRLSAARRRHTVLRLSDPAAPAFLLADEKRSG